MLRPRESAASRSDTDTVRTLAARSRSGLDKMQRALSPRNSARMRQALAEPGLGARLRNADYGESGRV